MRIASMLILAIAAAAVSPALARDAAVTSPAARASEKVVCHTDAQIGTLIPGKKVCHTRAEWDEHARAGQLIARKLVEQGTGRITSD